jgi:hypothetical protein
MAKEGGAKRVAKPRRKVNRATKGVPSGWMVKTSQGYYTGDPRSELERWTPFPRWAKVYHRHGWAQKMAVRLAGQVLPVAPPVQSATTPSNRLPLARYDGVSDGKG